jgi:hypothetical protein
MENIQRTIFITLRTVRSVFLLIGIRWILFVLPTPFEPCILREMTKKGF